MVDWIDLAFKASMATEITFVAGLWRYMKCTERYRKFRTEVLLAEANWRGGVRYRRRGMTAPEDNWQLWTMRREYVWRSFFFMKVDHLPTMRMRFITGAKESGTYPPDLFKFSEQLFNRKRNKILFLKDESDKYFWIGTVDFALSIDGVVHVYFTKDGSRYAAQIRSKRELRRRLPASLAEARTRISQLRIAARNWMNTVWLSV